MSRFLSLKLLATDGSKSRAVTRIRAVVATGTGSNLVRHFSLGQALGVNLVEPIAINFNRNPPGQWDPNDPSHNNPNIQPPSIAVILSGCGGKDGTDVHEAVYTMMHLHKHNMRASCFAPSSRIERVINHFTGERELDPFDSRFMLQESTRLTSVVYFLEALKVQDHQGLIVPSGNGIGFNLTNFNERLDQYEMDETLNNILLDFYWHRKPMGFLGLASILAARVFQGVRITFGDKDELLRHAVVGGGRRRRRVMQADRYIYAVESMGAILENKDIFEVLHDTNYHIYSTPGRLSRMPGRSYNDVSQGVGYLVDQMVQSLGDDE